VLTELAIGSSTDEAAAAIHLSPHTVRSHIKSALRKLRAQTRSHGVAIAITEGEIDVAEMLRQERATDRERERADDARRDPR